MERETIMLAATEALAREGFTEVNDSFNFSQVDRITRWVAALAIEKASQQTIPDVRITQAKTLEDLLDYVLEPPQAS